MSEAVRRELSDIGLRNRFAGAKIRVKEEGNLICRRGVLVREGGLASRREDRHGQISETFQSLRCLIKES